MKELIGQKPTTCRDGGSSNVNFSHKAQKLAERGMMAK